MMSIPLRRMASTTVKAAARAAAGLLAVLGLAAQEPPPVKAKPVATKHPLLWRIEGKVPQYLYGTIHIADERVAELPEEVLDAIDASDVVLTEIPMDAPTQAKGLRAMMLPPDQKLADLLPAEVHAKLVAYLESKGIKAQVVERLRPWAAGIFVTTAEARRRGATKALDQLVLAEAEGGDKKVGALETVTEQLSAMESFSDAEHAKMLNAALDALVEAERSGIDPLKVMWDLYLAGDVDRLVARLEELSGLEEGDPLRAKFEKVLLHDRNALMVDRLLDKIEAAPDRKHFVAVGAAHFQGEHGILALLEKRGRRVQRVGAPPAAEKKEEPAGAGRDR
jgi:uncharacterized protein YbaP (TraB family)